jgi:hypothetical protein
MAEKELKGDREVVLEAVIQAGYALKHASEELQGDKVVVLEAVKQSGYAGYALQHASGRLLGDKGSCWRLRSEMAMRFSMLRRS